MKNIIIIGAGHLGQDVYDLICSINHKCPTWNVKGFLNDFPVDLKSIGINSEVIGTIQGYQPCVDDHFVMAIGSPSGKEKIENIMKSKGCTFETLISPEAFVSDMAQIGEGSLIISTSKVCRCAHIGKFVVIGDSTVAFNASIGDYSNTASYSNVYKNIKVGKSVQIWSGAIILNTVGDGAMVGAGSVVINKVKNGTKVLGNPAKVIDV